MKLKYITQKILSKTNKLFHKIKKIWAINLKIFYVELFLATSFFMECSMTKPNTNTKLLSVKIRSVNRRFASQKKTELSNFRFEIIVTFCSRKSRVQTKKCFEPMIWQSISKWKNGWLPKWWTAFKLKGRTSNFIVDTVLMFWTRTL